MERGLSKRRVHEHVASDDDRVGEDFALGDAYFGRIAMAGDGSDDVAGDPMPRFERDVIEDDEVGCGSPELDSAANFVRDGAGELENAASIDVERACER